MVARLKLKGIDGRAPPGVNSLIRNAVHVPNYLLVASTAPVRSGRGPITNKPPAREAWLVPAGKIVLCRGPHHRIAGNP